MRIRTTTFAPSQPLPLVVEPDGLPAGRHYSADDFLHWLAEQRSSIEDLLVEHGGLLFRGMNTVCPEDLSRVCQALNFTLMKNPRDNARRFEIQDKISVSSEVPAFVPIALHNENSYTVSYPEKLVFSCQQPARRGGETPIADMQKVYDRIPRPVRDEFEERQIMYIDNVPRRTQIGRPGWPEMFGTADREEVERICCQEQLQCRWGRWGNVHLCGVRPAVLEHPRTGEKIWFNQAHISHPTYAAEFRHRRQWAVAFPLGIWEAFQRRFLPPRSLGQNALFGDGKPIPLRYLESIRQSIWNEMISFRWQRGDLLLLDNLRVAHGRMPYRGKRRILAALIVKSDNPETARTSE